MKKCLRCGHEKTWSGDDINCPFQDGDLFGDNWNCGIIGKIRLLCQEAETGKDARLHYQCTLDGENYAIIKTDGIDEEDMGLCLFVSWYKRRGATEVMYLIYGDGEIKQPTFWQLESIINHYKLIIHESNI